jgi:tripartite-type tricarboxylate transporter receptor subunit TctC
MIRILMLSMLFISFNVFADNRITMYGTSTAGGLYDLITHGVSDFLNQQGYPIIVENVSGAGGLIALGHFSKDENKALVIAGGDTISINILYDKIDSHNFIPIYYIGYSIPYFVSTQLKNLTCDNIKSKPLNIGTAGKNSSADIATKIVQQYIPNMQIIYYRGQADALRDVLAGNIDGAIVGYNSLGLLPVFNLTERSINGIPGITECIGGSEIYTYGFFIFANPQFTVEEITRLNFLLSQYVETDEFKILSQKFHLYKSQPKNLIGTKFQFDLEFRKYTRLSTEIDFHVEQ